MFHTSHPHQFSITGELTNEINHERGQCDTSDTPPECFFTEMPSINTLLGVPQSFLAPVKNKLI